MAILVRDLVHREVQPGRVSLTTARESSSNDGTFEPAPSSNNDKFWQTPSLHARMEMRMREEAANALKIAKTPAEHERLATLYSEESRAARLRLLAHPAVQAALDCFWTCADVDRSGYIERVEYMVLHRKVTLALNPSTVPQNAFAAARTDWLKDSEGRPKGIDKERFVRSWFE